MNPANWLLRAKKWAANPPSPGRVKMVLGVIAICAALYGYELLFGWPEALTTERVRMPNMR